MNVSLKEVFAILAVSAFSIAALTQPTRLMMWLFILFTFTLLVASPLLAYKKTQGRKSFWIWFAFTSISYLAFAYVPDQDGNSPRQTGPEPTTRLLVFAYELFGFEPVTVAGKSPAYEKRRFRIQNPDTAKPEFFGGFGTQESDPSATDTEADFSELFDLIVETTGITKEDFENSNLEFPRNHAGFGIYFAQKSHFRRFMIIGHCIWAICMGLALGVIAKAFTSRTKLPLNQFAQKNS